MVFLRTISTKRTSVSPTKYPLNLPAFQGGKMELNLESEITFFVGENGTGKSTLLEAIALCCGFHPWGGSRNNVYDYRSTESPLNDMLLLSWSRKVNHGFFLRAETYFNFANHIDDIAKEDAGVLRSYGGKSLHEQSHGESFLSLFQHRFGDGLFILDEPEAALSPTRQLSFLSLLKDREKNGRSQFLIATHSPILLSYPNATIYELTATGIRTTAYEDIEHVKLTREFLQSPQTYLRHLGIIRKDSGSAD